MLFDVKRGILTYCPPFVRTPQKFIPSHLCYCSFEFWWQKKSIGCGSLSLCFGQTINKIPEFFLLCLCNSCCVGISNFTSQCVDYAKNIFQLHQQFRMAPSTPVCLLSIPSEKTKSWKSLIKLHVNLGKKRNCSLQRAKWFLDKQM